VLLVATAPNWIDGGISGASLSKEPPWSQHLFLGQGKIVFPGDFADSHARETPAYQRLLATIPERMRAGIAA
jgi:hypothetical protein